MHGQWLHAAAHRPTFRRVGDSCASSNPPWSGIPGLFLCASWRGNLPRGEQTQCFHKPSGRKEEPVTGRQNHFWFDGSRPVWLRIPWSDRYHGKIPNRKLAYPGRKADSEGWFCPNRIVRAKWSGFPSRFRCSRFSPHERFRRRF